MNIPFSQIKLVNEKKQFLDNADLLFTTSKKAEQKTEHEAQTDKLYVKMGRLEMEVDFL